MFTAIKKYTAGVLILALALLAFLAILSIWDVLDKEVTTKSIYSMLMVSFSSVLIIIGATVGEGRESIFGFGKGEKGKHRFSIGRVILLFVGAYLLMQLFGFFAWAIF